jgi:hypothetical protein
MLTSLNDCCGFGHGQQRPRAVEGTEGTDEQRRCPPPPFVLRPPLVEGRIRTRTKAPGRWGNPWSEGCGYVLQSEAQREFP